jgi:hypothetical protein
MVRDNSARQIGLNLESLIPLAAGIIANIYTSGNK